MGIEPMTFDSYQEWAQHNQETECSVCYGRGWVLQEDASGRPVHEMPCPYCHGQRSAGWAVEHRASRFKFWDMVALPLVFATIALVVFGGAFSTSDPYSMASSYLFGLHLLLWLVLIAGWILWWIHHRPKEEKPGYRPRHAPGFTDNREAAALGIFAAGVGVRSLFGKHHR
jgi:hypothetical protein